MAIEPPRLENSTCSNFMQTLQQTLRGIDVRVLRQLISLEILWALGSLNITILRLDDSRASIY